MNVRACRFFSAVSLLVLMAATTLLAGVEADHTAPVCPLPVRHAGMAFPVDHIPSSWACRLQPLMTDYTTANKIGPIRTPLSEEIYLYLLDHPTVATTLVDRLELGLYKAVMQRPGQFWGSDGEGTEGVVQLVYEDRASRLYYLEGSHDGTVLPQVTGKAVVLLWMRPVQGSGGIDSMETTVVSYTRLNNRILSGFVSLIRPLLGNLITRQFMKGFDTADRLSRVMRDNPERVLFEATDPPALADAEVAFLKHVLTDLPPSGGSSDRPPLPR
ncbi:MAG TPA: hypothetical protein VHF07_08460 [Nitrospiraceae bacterium]|nr:hypothetical protein [Nitrospiraceae bacterium]